MSSTATSNSAHRVEGEIQGKKIIFESGWIAKQANGCVTVRMGDTITFAAATAGDIRDMGFMPLMVDYREKVTAAGKFPGGFIKREGRPHDNETIISRLIDRPIRPLFHDKWVYDTQVLCTVYSFDNVNPADVLVQNAAAASVHISDIIFNGPVASLRISRTEGEFIAFPTLPELEGSDMNLVLSATREGIVMVEAGMDILSEEDVLAAFEFAQPHLKTLLDLHDELRKVAGKEKKDWDLPEAPADLPGKVAKFEEQLKEVFFIKGKHERKDAIGKVWSAVKAELCPTDEQGNPLPNTPKSGDLHNAWMGLMDKVVREYALAGKRSDGRKLDEIRPIDIQIGLFPRTHGSALFTRGETQAIVTSTLGTGKDEQIVDGLREEYSKRFMLHYNFPPYSVGETKRIMGPGRREIGHGALAERALFPVIPPEEEFPYTVRVVSDITESNGSSSMATVCGGCISMMDAGVPIKAPVAGIAMGLIYDDDDHIAILTDILGSEDAHGDMDFKVAGTKDGITALQMDLKAAGLPMHIMKKALDQARDARLSVLDTMNAAIDTPREELSEFAPRHEMLKINPEKIGLIIGPGGKNIRDMEEKSGATIEIEDDGSVKIYSKNKEGLDIAADRIRMLTEELEIGKLYPSTVVSIKDFGAFVDLTGRGQEGLVHVTEITTDYVERVEDYLERGMEVDVKLLSREDNGKYRFSLKAAREEKGEGPLGRLDGQPPKKREDRPRRDSGGAGRFRDSRPRGGGGGRDRGRSGGGGRGGRDRGPSRDAGPARDKEKSGDSGKGGDPRDF